MNAASHSFISVDSEWFKWLEEARGGRCKQRGAVVWADVRGASLVGEWNGCAAAVAAAAVAAAVAAAAAAAVAAAVAAAAAAAVAAAAVAAAAAAAAAVASRGYQLVTLAVRLLGVEMQHPSAQKDVTLLWCKKEVVCDVCVQPLPAPCAPHLTRCCST